LNRQRNNGTTKVKDDHAFIVVAGIGSTPTSLLANTGTALSTQRRNRKKKSEGREIAILTVLNYGGWGWTLTYSTLVTKFCFLNLTLIYR
jgi:hypothetical protein